MTNEEEDKKKPSKAPPPLPPRKATQESFQEAALKKAQEASTSTAENGKNFGQFCNDYFLHYFFSRNENKKWRRSK